MRGRGWGARGLHFDITPSRSQKAVSLLPGGGRQISIVYTGIFSLKIQFLEALSWHFRSKRKPACSHKYPTLHLSIPHNHLEPFSAEKKENQLWLEPLAA